MGSTGSRLALLGALLAAASVSASVLPVGAAAPGQQPDATSPVWSPDGTEVAFAYINSSRFRIVAAPAAGGGPVRTIYGAKNADGCCDPMLWAAADRILFVANYTLMSVPASGGTPTRLFTGTPWFILSPNRETVAFTDGCGCGHAPDAIGLMSVRGGKPTVITKPKRTSDEIDGFSPDGTELIFTRYPFADEGSGGKATLMAKRVGGGGAAVPLRRTGIIGASTLPADAQRAQWSPDGRWIAFVRGLKLEVVSTTTPGRPLVLATHFAADAFSWSPDSTRLAADCCSNHPNQSLMTVDPQGTHRTVLWNDPSLHFVRVDSLDWPRWSPDSSKLVFMARSGPGYPAIQVSTVGADGQGLTRLG